MSEVLLGILRMQHPDDNPVITRQFIAAARNAADEIERLQSLLDAEIASNHRLSERELSLAEAIELPPRILPCRRLWHLSTTIDTAANPIDCLAAK